MRDEEEVGEPQGRPSVRRKASSGRSVPEGALEKCVLPDYTLPHSPHTVPLWPHPTAAAGGGFKVLRHLPLWRVA